MTATTRSAPARVRPSARVLAACALIAVIFGVLFWAVPAQAATDVDEDDGIVELVVTAGTHGVTATGSSVVTSIDTVNGSGEEFPAGTIQLELNRTPLTDSNALETWNGLGVAAGTFEEISSIETEAVAAESTAERSVLVAGEKMGALPVGVYPLRATLRAADDADDADATNGQGIAPPEIRAYSVLIVRDEASPTVTVLVPITATPADGALLGADELAALTAPDGALTAQLDGVSGTSAVLAVDPLIPAAIRALGSGAPATAVAWLERLDDMPQERFSLQAADADAVTQTRAGLSALLSPTTLTPYLAAENFRPTPEPTPAPADVPETTPTPGAPIEPDYPSTEELLELERAAPAVLWPLDEVSTGDLDAFAGIFGDEATTIISSSDVTGDAAAHGVLNGHSALIVNDDVSAVFEDLLAEEDATARGQELTTALAELVIDGNLGSSLLIGLERNETRTADALEDVIKGAFALGDDIGLQELRASDPAALALTTTGTTDRAQALGSLLQDEEALRQFATILDDPEVLLSPERLRLLRVLSNRSDTDFDDAVSARRAATQETLGAVTIQDPGSPQLLTAQAPLPIWVTNNLPWPVNLRLHANLDSVILHIQPVTEATAQQDSNTRISVPVEARVASGEVDVTLSLTSPSGVSIGSAQTAQVTVRAEWEGIGLIVLGSVIGLLLIVGIVRTVRRRKATAVAEATDATS